MPGQPLAADVRNNMFYVDSRRLLVDKDYIKREDYGDIDSLVRWIEANGLTELDPLRCYKRGNDYVVIRGHRRRKAIKILEGRTTAVLMVPIVLQKRDPDVEQRFFEQAAQNDALPYSPLEKAMVLRHVRDEYKWTREKIIEKSGWSKTYVVRLLALAEAPDAFLQLIRTKRISGTEALELVAKGKVAETLQKAAQGQLPVVNAAAEPTEEPPRKQRIIVGKPVSWKKVQKWTTHIEEKDLNPEKARFLQLVRRILEGDLTEEDFTKFFL